MIKHVLITMGMAAIAVTAFAAQAQTDDTGAMENAASGQSFTTMDADGNGQISWSEAENGSLSHSAFKSADSNGDGTLSESEYKATQTSGGDSQDTQNGMGSMSGDSMDSMSNSTSGASDKAKSDSTTGADDEAY